MIFYFILIVLTITNILLAIFTYRTHKGTKRLLESIGFDKLIDEDMELFFDFYSN